MRIRSTFGVCLYFGLMSVASLSFAAAAEDPGARLVRENNCVACHHIGTKRLPGKAPLVGPDFAHAGHRLNPRWLLAYLLKPKKLRPAKPARMGSFRFSGNEASDLTAFLMTRHSDWPKPTADAKEEERPISFGALYAKLTTGDARRGRTLFEQNECLKCHGDPGHPDVPFAGKPEERGPDLREMAQKLTRMGVASMLFQPDLIHKKTKMPAFFFDQGEAMDEQAHRQLADVTAYIQSLKKSAASLPPFGGGDAASGRELATRLNCAGCHGGLGVPSLRPDQIAVTIGYRNAPPGFTFQSIADWIREPETVFMHERMHGLGRMPTFGFSRSEAEQITRYLFSIDGPPHRGSGMMMGGGMFGRMRGILEWLLGTWDRLFR